MKISELKPKVGGIELEFDVIDKGPVREFNKFGKAGRVCNVTVKDESGQVKLSLWNEDCDKINVGDKVKLTDGWTGEYQGEIQLSTGRAGKLEVIGKGDASAASKPSAAQKPAPVMRNFSVEPEKSKFKKPGSDSFDDGSDDDSDDEGGSGGDKDFEDDDFEDVDEEFVE